LRFRMNTRACPRHWLEIYVAGASRPRSLIVHDVTAWDGLRGLSPLLSAEKADFEASIGSVKGGHCDSIRRFPCTRRSCTVRCRASIMDGSKVRAKFVDRAMSWRKGSGQLDPRSSFAIFGLALYARVEGRFTRPQWTQEKGRSSYVFGLKPLRDMGAPRPVFGIFTSWIARHRQGSILFSTAVQRGNSDPDINWRIEPRSGHYLWDNMMLRCPGGVRPFI